MLNWHYWNMSMLYSNHNTEVVDNGWEYKLHKDSSNVDEFIVFAWTFFYFLQIRFFEVYTLVCQKIQSKRAVISRVICLYHYLQFWSYFIMKKDYYPITWVLMYLHRSMKSLFFVQRKTKLLFMLQSEFKTGIDLMIANSACLSIIR